MLVFIVFYCFIIIYLQIEAKYYLSMSLTFKGDCSLICITLCIFNEIEGCLLKWYGCILYVLQLNTYQNGMLYFV